MHVVLNFHRKDQHSARLLLELLLSVDEGTAAVYHLQYGNVPESLEIADTVVRFMEHRTAVFSTDWPDDPVPQSMRENDPNLDFLAEKGGGGATTPRSRPSCGGTCVFSSTSTAWTNPS